MPRPAPEVEVLPTAGRAGPLRVRIRDGRAVAVPGSEGSSSPVAALGADGTVAVAWETSQVCGGEDGGKSFPCDASVLASVWRQGASPPRGTLLHDPAVAAAGPDVEVGADGTVLVAFDEVDGIYYDDRVRVLAAVGQGGAPLTTTPVGASGASGLGVVEVRGAPQLAWAQPAGGGLTEIRLASASGGALGGSRREARVRMDDSYELELRRSERGDRLLRWTEREEAFRVAVGGPGRRLGRARAISAVEATFALGEAGDYAVLSRRSERGEQRLRLLRGRTTSSRVLRERLDPQYGSLYAVDLYAEVAIDVRGRAYVVHDTPVGRGRNGDPRLGIAGHSAARGRPFPRGRVISSRRRKAFCNGATLSVLRPGHAVARWTCARSLDPSNDFDEQARYVPARGG